MIIRVKGYASMKKFTEHLPAPGHMEVPGDSTVESVLRMLHVPSAYKKVTMTNGRHCRMDKVLKPGDELVFFPPLEGG